MTRTRRALQTLPLLALILVARVAHAEPVRLTWRVAPAERDLVQEAYEIDGRAAVAVAAAASSGVEGRDDQVMGEAPGGARRRGEGRF